MTEPFLAPSGQKEKLRRTKADFHIWQMLEATAHRIEELLEKVWKVEEKEEKEDV